MHFHSAAKCLPDKHEIGMLADLADVALERDEFRALSEKYAEMYQQALRDAAALEAERNELRAALKPHG